MTKEDKIEAKLTFLRGKLQNLGHAPSISEDRVLNANIKYYYNKYADHPLVRQLKTDFPLEIKKRRLYTKHSSIESRAASIEEKLRILGRVPTAREDSSLLSEINYCYRVFSQNRAIMRLRKLYPTNTLYSKWGPKGSKDSFSRSICMDGLVNCGGASIYTTFYYEDPFIRAKRYIFECIKEYNELPGINTWPMHFVLERLYGTYRDGVSTETIDFFEDIIQKGVADEDIQSRYYSAILDKSPLFERIYSILQKRKICSIGYIAKNIMPGINMSCDRLYQFFYYLDHNCGHPKDGIEPSHRHLFRMIDFQTENSGRIVSLPLESLLNLDYDSIASKQTINTLPSYSIDFTDEEEIQYANAFLFHIETECDYINKKVIRKINYSQTLIDELKDGRCPFRFLDNAPFFDAPDMTIEWCSQLVSLNSKLLEKYVKDESFFKSFDTIIERATSENSKEQIGKLLTYLKQKFNLDIKY